MKILEKSDGDVIMLICEGRSQKEGEVLINLIGNGEKITTKACILRVTECFSKLTTTYIALPKDLSRGEVEKFEYIEFV